MKFVLLLDKFSLTNIADIVSETTEKRQADIK